MIRYANQVTYKGESLPVVYTPAEGARYTVCARKRALHGKWFVFVDNREVLAVCEYRRGAIRVCDELTALAMAASK